jgi:hypothetical protein
VTFIPFLKGRTYTPLAVVLACRRRFRLSAQKKTK